MNEKVKDEKTRGDYLENINQLYAQLSVHDIQIVSTVKSSSILQVSDIVGNICETMNQNL